jgi:thymidylate synthase (FAD)
VFSFTQESTRYVNYGNRGMVLILPEELYSSYDAVKCGPSPDDLLGSEWLKRAEVLFNWYREDLARGLRPEIARDILPNLLKSELFVSGRWSGWKHFILLRDSSQAHPRIRFLAKEVRKYFAGLGLEC